MMKYNRREYDRMSAILHRIMDMLTQLKPMNERLNAIVKKYSAETGADGSYSGKFMGKLLSGTLQFTITGAKVKGYWTSKSINNPSGTEGKGELTGVYDPKSGNITVKLSGIYKADISYAVTGDLKGVFSGAGIKGTWVQAFLTSQSVPVPVDSGSFEASK